MWSFQITASSYRITILRLPVNYNHRTGLQTSVGGARMHCMHACMHRRANMYTLTIILATSLKLLMIRKAISNCKTKPMVETMTKTAQYVHDIELHFTEKEKRTQTRK